MERLGVVTRVFPDVGIRVTIGDAAANVRFLEAFAKVAVDVDPVAWQLPTGDLAVRVADHLDELDAVLARLEAHAAADAPSGLTEPDAGGTERWEAGQVWAHLAEFGAYWREELRMIVDTAGAADDGPVPFGRTKRDPHRIAMIEAHRHEPITHQVEIVRRDIAALPRRSRRTDCRRLVAPGRPRDARRDGPLAVPRPLRHRPLRRARRPARRSSDRESGWLTRRPSARVGTWVADPAGSPFPLHNLPFGVGRRPDGSVGAFVAIGDQALDLARAGRTGLLDGTWGQHGLLGTDGSLNDFAAAGRQRTPRCASG